MGEKVVINVGRNGHFALSIDAIKWLAERGNENALDYATNPRLVQSMERDGGGADIGIWRTDPLLIECIEALGERADHNRTKLKIVELPDDVGEWQVDDVTHGIERIIEVGRSWD